MTKQEQLIRLWVHESLRVFYDRLADEEDRTYFIKLIQSLTAKYFDENFFERVVPDLGVVYADFLAGENANVRHYIEATERTKLNQVVTEFLEDYNLVHSPALKLVMFDYAVDHVARICRILRQPNGNALLIGLPGSGCESLTKLAAHIADKSLFQVDIKQTYGPLEWKEDMRKLLKKVGIEGKPIVFLFKDSQITNELFIEDIHNLLNSGEVPNLYPPEEMKHLFEDFGPVAKDAQRDSDKEVMYWYFIERCKQNL